MNTWKAVCVNGNGTAWDEGEVIEVIDGEVKKSKTHGWGEITIGDEDYWAVKSFGNWCKFQANSFWELVGGKENYRIKMEDESEEVLGIDFVRTEKVGLMIENIYHSVESIILDIEQHDIKEALEKLRSLSEELY